MVSLAKFIKVENVGRFTKLAPKGDLTFRKLTLIYGGNGHGKTTLAGVLRSLQTGDASYIEERATLGATDQPAVEIRLSQDTARFASGRWSTTTPELEIFDSTFVTENVYTGDHVGNDHRKNLYQVVVGSGAVKLAKRIDEIASESRQVANAIRVAEDDLREHIQAPFDLDAFIGLQPIDDVQDQIQQLTAELSAVLKSKEVLARPQLAKLSGPAAPRGALVALDLTIERMSRQAEQQVRNHLHTRLGSGGEQWIRQGLGHVKDENCPFCGQDLDGVELISLYREYFTDSYEQHLVTLRKALDRVDQDFSEQALSAIEKRKMENDSCIRGWADLADLGYASHDIDRLMKCWRHARDVITAALRRKIESPTETVQDRPALEAALQAFEEATGDLLAQNDQVSKANDEISAIKKQAASADASELEADRRRLRNTQIRQEDEVSCLCEALASSRETKKKLDAEKKQVRTQLEAHAEQVLAEYETAINGYLRKFGANFQVAGTRPSFAGGRASSTYQIAINGVPIELGDSRTPRGTPCFRTALSSGDKSTLALAFFLARVEKDPDLATKIVVFDDPLSSFDCFRIACTQHEIGQLVARAAQVVVLSHDVFFLKRIFDASVKPETKTIHVVREGGSSTLREWDIERYCMKDAHQDYFILREFIEDGVPDGGDLIPIARSIRPYLEGHLRQIYPDAFGPTEWVGDFIRKVRESSPGDQLAQFKPKLPELEAVNEYSKHFHHTEQGGATATTTDDELRAFAQRAIGLVQG